MSALSSKQAIFLIKLIYIIQDPDDLDEITTGVRTALKSWLTFGASITGTKSKSVASVARESVSEACPNQSRMRVMFR